MVKLIILFDNIYQKPAIEKTKKRFRNPKFIGFTQVMRLDTIWGKSPALFNGGLLLGNIDHIVVLHRKPLKVEGDYKHEDGLNNIDKIPIFVRLSHVGVFYIICNNFIPGVPTVLYCWYWQVLRNWVAQIFHTAFGNYRKWVSWYTSTSYWGW